MGTALPKEPLRSLVSSLMGVPIDLVVWAGGPLSHPGPHAGVVTGPVTLNLTASKQIGDTDVRETWNAGTSKIDRTQRVDRIVTISVRYRAMGSEEGFDALERLRARLNWEASTATLNAAGLSIVDVSSVRTYTDRSDNRDLSTAQLDMRLNFMGTDTPPSVDNIQSVSGSGLGISFTVP